MDISPALVAECVRAEQRREYDALVLNYIHMVYCRTLPPDDAYGWTRAVVWEAEAMQLIDLTPPA